MTDLELLKSYVVIEGEGMEYCKNSYHTKYVGIDCDYCNDYSCKNCPHFELDREKLERDIKEELEK